MNVAEGAKKTGLLGKGENIQVHMGEDGEVVAPSHRLEEVRVEAWIEVG